MKQFLWVCALSGCLTEPQSIVEAMTESSSSSDDGTFGSVTADSASESISTTTSMTGLTSSSQDSGSDSGTDESTSGDAETSFGSSDSTESSTGAHTSPYASCTMDDTSMCSGEEECIATDGTMEGIEPTGWCAAHCNEDSDCPAPDDGTAVPRCEYNGAALECMLLCTDGETCPTGMSCLEMMWVPAGTLAYVCVWE